MSEFFYVMKCLIFSMIVVLVMQFKIGSETIEQRSYKILTASVITQTIHQVAEGAILITKKGYEEISKKANEGLSAIRENNKDNALIKMWNKEEK